MQRRFGKNVTGYHSKFGNTFDEIENGQNELKKNLSNIDSHLHISRNVKNKLSDSVVNLEEKYGANKLYFREVCLEIPGIPIGLWDKHS